MTDGNRGSAETKTKPTDRPKDRQKEKQIYRRTDKRNLRTATGTYKQQDRKTWTNKESNRQNGQTENHHMNE